MANYSDQAQKAAEKLDKETKAAQEAQQSNAEKTWQNLNEGKIQPPTENDMGPKPIKKKKGGKIKVKKMASGGKVRGCGCESKGKTKGRFI
jgi:hypothetical protein